MAEPPKDPTPPRISADAIWYAIPGLILVLFFAWVLWEMGNQAAGSTLVRMLLGILIVLGGGGIVFAVLAHTGGGDDER
jgi:hypothetical protein